MECFCISRRVCGSRSVLSNTGLLLRRCFASPSVLPEDPGLLQVADISAGFSGKTGLWDRQEVDLTTDVKLSWDENTNSELQLWTWSLQGLGQVAGGAFLPNTGLLQFSGVESPPSPSWLSEKTGLLQNARSLLWLGLLGNVGLQSWAGKDFIGELSWEHHTNPELTQVCSRSWLRRGTWTSALK